MEPLLRLGMRAACVDGGLTVVGEAGDRRSLRDSTGSLTAPTVIVSDVDLLRPDVVATVRELAGAHRVLVLDGDGLDRPRLLRAGASGFVCRRTAAAALCDAVASAQRGQLVLNGYDDVGARQPPAPAGTLTPRERDVLRLIAAGGSTTSASRELHLSPTTLKTHLRSASVKLGTQSRASAVARATRLGLLE